MDLSTLARVESQRLELETNITKLRKGLRHWQTLEIDYEGLKEEFQVLPEDASLEKCLQIAKDYNSDSIDEEEVRRLFEDKYQTHKKPAQIIAVLSKRVEYVLRNIDTLRKQVLEAEKRRNALLLALDPDHQDEAALPLSEITEELDEEGNVVSSKVENPGKEAPTLLNVLRKAGVTDVKNVVDEYPPGVKNPDTATKTDDPMSSSKVVSQALRPAPRPTNDNRISELSDNEDILLDEERLGPTNPDDTEEDAALRQDMLQYGLGEVGAIVAELDLEDSANIPYDEDDPDDYLSDYDEDGDLYTDESEDEKGATKNPVISEQYRRQMELLSKKHGITEIENLGPEAELSDVMKTESDRPPAAQAAAKAAIARDEAIKSVLKSADEEVTQNKVSKSKKKRVGFAPVLDIAKETNPLASTASREQALNPVGERVVERNANDNAPSSTPPKVMQQSLTPKISRFKAARSAEPQTPMFPPPMLFPTTSTKTHGQGPPGQTIAATLVERSSSEISQPADPIDFDEELHRREVAIEYQKMRNRKIHEQGGYVNGGEAENYGEELVPETLIDENTGKQRKISRFKAARLKSPDR